MRETVSAPEPVATDELCSTRPSASTSAPLAEVPPDVDGDRGGERRARAVGHGADGVADQRLIGLEESAVSRDLRAQVHLAGARAVEQRRDVVGPDRAAGEHRRHPRPLRPGAQGRQHVGALARGRRPTRGQHAHDAVVGERLVRLEQVGGVVEGLVEGDRHVAGGRADRIERLLVDATVGGEGAEHDAHRHAALAGEGRDGGGIGSHHAQLVGRVDEVAAARAHHDLHAHALHRGEHRLDHSQAGRRSALEQIGAEFDAIGPRPLGGEDSGEVVDADLDKGAGPRPGCSR